MLAWLPHTGSLRGGPVFFGYSEPEEAPKPPPASFESFESFSKLGLQVLCAFALGIGQILLAY